MPENIQVTDDISLWVADGKITLCGDDSNAMVEIEYDDIDMIKRKLDAAALVAMEQRQSNPCPYTQAHTREFCGRPGCRES